MYPNTPYIFAFSYIKGYCKICYNKSMEESTLTCIPRYMSFVLNSLSYIYETSPHHIQKTNFWKTFPYLTHQIQYLSFNISFQVVALHCLECRYLDKFAMFVYCTSLPPDIIYSMQKFGWPQSHPDTTQFFEYTPKFISTPNLWGLPLYFYCRSIIIF